MSDIVKYTRQDAVAVIALNRPETMNAFTSALRLDLIAALQRCRDDAAVKAVVLTGEGRCFSSGADLRDAELDSTVTKILQDEYRPIQELIATMPGPVIAAIPGAAAGIGLSVALNCDLVIMADDAFMVSPFSTISLVPDGGLNWILVRQLGYRLAFQLSVEAERIAAGRCVELGLANRLVPAENLRQASVDWAVSLANRAPLAIAATKKALRYAADHDWASSYDFEVELQGDLLGSRDNREGIAAFLERRAPDFKGE